MYLDTVSNLKSWQDKESHWLSNPVLHSGEGKHQVSIELYHAIGKSPKIPCGAVDQPEFEVKGSKFMFDDKVFKGKQAKSDIIDILKKSCPGCTLYLQDDGKSSKNSFQLRCNHYPQQSKESKEKFSIPDEFSKDNIAPFTKKQKSSKGQNAWDRFNNQKMKSNKRPHVQRAKKLRRRKGWKRAYPIVVEEHRNKRGDSVLAKSAEQR